MFYVYILESLKDGKHYIGFTEDIERRIKEHSNGEVESTRIRRPLELVYYEAFKYEEDARKQELFYKTGQGRRILKKRLKNKLIIGEVA